MRRLLAAALITAAMTVPAEADACVGVHVVVNGDAEGHCTTYESSGVTCVTRYVVHMPPPLSVLVTICFPTP